MVQMSPQEKAQLALLGISRPVVEQDNSSLEKAKIALEGIKIKETVLRPPVKVQGTGPTNLFQEIRAAGQGTEPKRDITRADIARSRGFDPEQEGGTTSQRLAGRFGEIQDVKNALAAGTDFNPDDFDVANLEGIGIIFKAPDQEKFSILDPIGLDVGDIAVEGADILPTVAEAGTLIATKSPTAAAVAGGATRAAILATLKATGIVEDPDIIADSLLEAGLSIVGAKAPGAAKAAKEFLDPTKNVLKAVTSVAEEAAFKEGAEITSKVAADVERVGGVRPKFTVAEELGAVEPEKAAELAGAEKAAGALIDTTRSQRLATEGIREKLAVGAAEGVEEVGEQIIEKQATRVSAAIKKAETNATAATKRANATINKITGDTNPEEIRSVLEKGVEDVNKAIKSAYNEVEAQARAANFDLKEVSDLSKAMIDKVRFGAVGKSIFSDSKKFVADFDKAVKEGKGLDSYKVLQEARSEVRATIRSLRDVKGSGVQIKEAVALEKEITNTINDALSKIDPKLAEQLVETDLAFAKMKQDIDKGLVGALLAKRGGQPKIPSENIVKTILGNSSNTKALLQAAEDFPEINAKSQLRDAFFTGYEKQVINGNVTHDAYMKQIKDTGDLIFTKGELKALENAGSAQTQIKNIMKRKEDRIITINKTFNAKLTKFEPVELVKKVSKSQGDTAKLKKILSPQEWLDYQAARRAKAIRDMTNTKKELTLSGVDKVLNANRPELVFSLGEQYVKDLEVAQEFLTVLAKKQQGVGLARASAAGVSEVDIAKAMLFGPLSHKGFVIGKIKGFGKDRAQKAMIKLLNDPDLLRERIRISKLPPNEQLIQLQQLWGGLGLPLALNRGTDIEEVKDLPND